MNSNAIAVKRYFDDFYPRRGTWKAKPFRAHARERLAIVERWLPSLHGKTVCDVGCGDGELIRRILSTRGVPSNLSLHDISERAVADARLNLAGSGVAPSGRVGDAITDGIGGPYDIVLAIGLADYYPDWNVIIRRLLTGTNQLLILDFPRRWKLRNLPRRLWLRSKGLTLNAASRSEVIELIGRETNSFEIAESEYNWFVKVTTSTDSAPCAASERPS